MGQAIGSLWFRQHVGHATEVVSATTSVDDGQLPHLSRQFGFSLLRQQLLKFGSQFREQLDKQFGSVCHHRKFSREVSFTINSRLSVEVGVLFGC